MDLPVCGSGVMCCRRLQGTPPCYLRVASDSAVESRGVPCHHHPVHQRSQELGGCSEIMLLVFQWFQGDSWRTKDTHKVSPTPTPARSYAQGRVAGPCTCLEDASGVLGDARRVTETTDVLAEDAEVVLIAHNEVRHRAAGVATVLVDIEPLLEWGEQRTREGKPMEGTWVRGAVYTKQPVFSLPALTLVS